MRNITCIGFNKLILPYILKAFERKEVRWIEDSTSCFAEAFSSKFEWCGCIWEIDEIREHIQSIGLVEGKPDNIDLTAMVLRG